MPKRTFYVTTPIYYVNDRPHIGHLYTTTIADVLARYHRLRGEEVFFLTGTDEHAAKVADAAAERGLTAQEWADQNAREFSTTFARLGISNDDFIRTSAERHKNRVKVYVERLVASDDVYLGEFEGWYDAGQEEYVPDNKAEEHEFKSPINGRPLVRKAEKNYFFRLSRYSERLLQHLEKHPECVQPEARRNEVLGRIAQGLNDVPITRTGTRGWGIAFPGDAEHTIYVWIDALFNYLSTVDTEERRHLWPADVHLIGKEILWFHAVVWPALLMALSQHRDFAWASLPKRLYAHSFWIAEGRKMSKSLGNFIDLETIDRYVERFGLDAFRWFLAATGPLGAGDSDFAEARFIEVYNHDLANTFGNCLNRVVNMTGRYLEGKLPRTAPPGSECQAAAESAVATWTVSMDELALDRATAAVLDLVSAVDTYIDRTKPFTLAKDPATRPNVGPILYNCAEALRIAALLLGPFMPGKADAMAKALGWIPMTGSLDAERDLTAKVAWGALAEPREVAPGTPLFPRYEPT